MDCLLCETSSAPPQTFGSPPRPGRCPSCQSTPSHRELAWFFLRYLRPHLGEQSKVLEVGPSPSQVTHFPRPQFLGEARYTAVDTRRSALHDALKVPHRFLPMDVTHMTFSDQSFDIILCQQVLPFVRSDYQAMSEMHRCLKTTGIALLNAHCPLDKTRPASEMRAENPALYSDEYLAENGNEWVYGEDYFERLEAAGFFPHELALAPWVESDFAERQLFAPSAKLVLCFKFRDQKNRFLGAL